MDHLLPAHTRVDARGPRLSVDTNTSHPSSADQRATLGGFRQTVTGRLHGNRLPVRGIKGHRGTHVNCPGRTDARLLPDADAASYLTG